MTKRALIADDTSYMRTSLRDILKANGFLVTGEAQDGEEALTLYRQLQPDVMILNLVMPKLTGLDVLKAIRSWDPNAKIIICSAMAQASSIFSAVQAGASDFIIKPFTPDDLLKSIDRILE